MFGFAADALMKAGKKRLDWQGRTPEAIIGLMVQFIEAVYENGVFRPLAPLPLADQTRVLLRVSESSPEAAEELSLAEFDRHLDQLSSDGASPPGTFSRAEIYADHD